ncbi:MAG TPA: glycerol-3-phosphate acyltransferase [Ignavibacteria bacterium]
MTPFILNYILICLLFYIIGSIPSAYLIVRSRKIDITKAGSGNVGALNSYEVTKSKTIGILVLVLDFLKGFIPAFLLAKIILLPLSLAIFPLLLLVAGHNFSVWIKFKGGRGLATTAGIFVVVNFWLFIIWGVLFLVIFAVRRNVHIGNIAATVLMPLVTIFISDFIVKYNYDFGLYNDDVHYNFNLLFTLSASVCILILIKHIKPLIELIRETKNKKEIINE